jgi:type IV pilus assembly protein PilA
MSVARTRDRGFTLVEIMVVVAILGVLVSIAVLSYTASTSRARRIACESNQRAFRSAVQLYRSEHEEDPAGIEDLRPFVSNYDTAIHCTEPGATLLEYDSSTGLVTCENHPF